MKFGIDRVAKFSCRLEKHFDSGGLKSAFVGDLQRFVGQLINDGF